MAKSYFLFTLHFIALFYTLHRSLSGLQVTIISTLPFGAGLGSSAAYSVCLSAAFLQAMAAACKPSTETPYTDTTCSTTPPPKQLPVAPGSLSTSTTDQYAAPSLLVSGSDRSVLDCGSIPEEILRRLEKETDVVLGSLRVKAWNQKELLDSANEWGFKAEQIIHGTPSGIDNSISTFGMLYVVFILLVALINYSSKVRLESKC